MKHITKLWALAAIFFVSSCGLTELDLLDSPNSVTPENAQADLFFTAIQLDIENLHSSQVGVTSRLMRQLAMTSGNSYENAYGATTFNGVWNVAYANLLPDLDALISNAEAEPRIPGYAGVAKVMKAYVLMTVVDMFGNVPFSEAGQGTLNLSPGSDDQSSIYTTALGLLDQGIANLQETGPGINAGADLFFGGDLTKWEKLANTLKIKYYLNVGAPSGGNGADIAAAAANAITMSADDWQFSYGTERDNPNSRHPWYNDGYENGAGIYQSNYFMWSLKEQKGFADPRLPYYFYRQDLTPVADIDAFTLDCGGQTAPLHYNNFPFCHLGEGYWGRDHGNDDGIPPDDDRRTVAGIYPAGGLYDSGQGAPGTNGGMDGALGGGIAPLMLSSYTHFMLAEAALTRGTGGDAAALLEEGIRQSMAKVLAAGAEQADTLAATMEDVDGYVAFVMDSFNGSDAAGKLNVVMKEYHIASWGNGLEAFNGYRRTTYPTGLQPTLEVNGGTFPRLNYYPADFLNLNANSGEQRDLSEQIFWDTNPAGAIN